MEKDSKKEEYNTLKTNYKLLQKQLREEIKVKGELNEEITQLKTTLIKKQEEIESFQINNQGLIKRIQLLQEKDKEGSTKSSGSYGWNIFGSSGYQTSKEEFEKMNTQFKIVQEELEAKILENTMVHEKIFHLSRDYQDRIDALEKTTEMNKITIHELETNLNAKVDENLKLLEIIDNEKIVQQKIQEELRNLQEKYSLEIDNWNQKFDELKYELEEAGHKFKQKMPFDPFNNTFNHLNEVKCTKQQQEKQVNSIKQIQSTISNLQKGLEQMLNQAKIFLDGQSPVGDNLSQTFQKFLKYIHRINFLDEQSNILIKSSDAKTINENLKKCLQNIKYSLSQISNEIDTFKDQSQDAYAQALFIQNVSEELLKIKNELQSMAKQYKRKIQLIKDDKIMFNKFETKSNNLKILGEELLNQLHLLTGQVDQTHNSINMLKSLALIKNSDHKGKTLQAYVSLNFSNASNQQGVNNYEIQGLIKNIDQIPLSIPYEEQVANKQSIVSKDQEIRQLNGQILKIENDNKDNNNLIDQLKQLKIKLESSLKLRQNDNQNLKEQILVWIDQVQEKYQDSNFSQNQQQEQSQNSYKNEYMEQLLSLKQLVSDDKLDEGMNQSKGNNDDKIIIQQIVQDSRDFYLYEDVYKGMQKLSIQVQKHQGQNVALNHFTSQSIDQKLALLQEKSLQKVLQMAQKLHNMNKLSQGSNLQVIEKDREWKLKYDKLKSDLDTQIQQLNYQLENAINDKQVISRNYEDQLKMMGELLVDLNTENDKLKKSQ
ncbi:UNKNOWN [Stylonychia lemnae]|uniref:Protein phosphatase 1 regulatory subunit 21 N-terminal domain-containing protein n=1 Tax=Stylonychia lemnae TaxID=5949 RepID=A0A078B3D1_STYLE|nr:UNKNOWN [Stylonychia lemnae]|eukprot:CDW88949.1 UNKNOWN [Stylonychia lemnae]